MPSYPMYLPGTQAQRQGLIFEDTNGDGKADSCTVFADGLHLPTGIELGDGGVYLSQMPNLMFLKDTNGDDRADTRELILHGFDTADSHHAMHAFTWDPGGALYWQEGTFHHSQVETPYGPRRCNEAGIFRCEPRTWKFDVFVSYGFANPWGHYFDRWGQNFVADASGGANYFGTAFSGQVVYPHKHGGMKQFFPMQWRPTCGCELVSSRHFPDDTQGDYLLNNNIGFQGILRYRVKEDGSGFTGDAGRAALEVVRPEFPPGRSAVRSRRGALRRRLVQPADRPHAALAPRSQSRPYATAGSGGSPIPSGRSSRRPKIAGASVPELLDLLKSYEDRTRYRARRELRERPEQEVLSALDKWVAQPEQERPRILAAHARGPLAAPEPRRRRRPAAQADADLPRAPRPRRRDPRAVLLARPRRATRSSCCASRSTTSIPACGSKRSARSASSTATRSPRRRRSPSSRCSIPRTITSNTPSTRPPRRSIDGSRTRASASDTVQTSHRDDSPLQGMARDGIAWCNSLPANAFSSSSSGHRAVRTLGLSPSPDRDRSRRSRSRRRPPAPTARWSSCSRAGACPRRARARSWR